MAKTKYFKLGKKASSFYDPSTGVKIANNMVVEHTGQVSQRMRIALDNHHIEPAEEKEYTKYTTAVKSGKPAPATEAEASNNVGEGNLADMTKAELTDYYKSNYEVSDEEVDDFKGKNKAEMVEYLEDLAEEDDDE